MMRGARLRVVVALAGAVAAIGAAAPRDAGPAFTVGVLRRDGIVVPFATFGGKEWRSDWPMPKDHVDVPINLASVPRDWWGKIGPREEWQGWIGGEPPRVLHVTQPDWFPAQCLRQVGLRTDYRPSRPVAPLETQPYPKDGLAVSPPTEIEPIEHVPPGDVTAPVLKAFNDAESLRLRFTFPRLLPVPSNDETRQRAPVDIEATYAYGPANGRRIYYVEATRTHPRPDAGAACGAVTFGGGWFVRDGGGPLTSLGFDATIVKCDRYGLAYMLPLGVMRVAGRLFWIAQWSGWDYERYEVVEITPGKAEPVLAAFGGSC